MGYSVPSEGFRNSVLSNDKSLVRFTASATRAQGGVACYFRIQYQDSTGHRYETDMCFHGLPRANIILSYCLTALHLNSMIDCKNCNDRGPPLNLHFYWDFW